MAVGDTVGKESKGGGRMRGQIGKRGSEESTDGEIRNQRESVRESERWC